jgi:hypothetical protein
MAVQHSIPQKDDERELGIIITIDRDVFVRWTGTRAQLEAEDLIPEGTQWPERNDSIWWDAGQWSFHLCRTRPAAMKGPMKLWVEGDWWCLSRQGPMDWYAIRVARARRELDNAIWRASPEGRADWDTQPELWNLADSDEAFQRFKSIFIPAPKPRRTSKSP